MTATTAAPFTERETLLQNRWLILVAGIVCMIAIANYQYGWTLFVKPLQKQLHTDGTAPIQIAFTVFVLLETWLVPFEGWLVDKFGPRNLVLLGGIVAGAGWYFSGSAASLTQLYLAYALSGIGAGVVYGTSVGSALKWFPDRRGLAAGLTAMGFGAGSALTVQPIQDMINSGGYQATFQQWGIIQGAVVVVAALFLRAPPKGWLPRTWTLEATAQVKKRQTALDFTPVEMASTKQFWMLYLMMAMVATGGLMATAQLAPMAADFKVDKFPVSFLWINMTAITFALSADRVVNGLCRPFWGWVSDHIGREKTMSLAFGLEGLAITLLILSLQVFKSPLLFVVMSGFTFFGWAEIFSLFPATAGDFFGRKYATTNYGFLYTAKGTASVFVPIGSALAAGKAFDFRADILLLIGALLVFFTMFFGPQVMHVALGRTTRTVLFAAAALFLVYGIALTVVASIPAPFAAKLTVPHTGWGGVFAIAVVFDWIAAILAFFVLRRMAVPAAGERPSVAQPTLAPAPAD